MPQTQGTTLEKEPVYISYGQDLIDQQAFLDAAANNVMNYVNSQSWSRKRKEKFLNAYTDIISKGIIGANNSTGQWAVDLSQSIDLDSKSEKDQQMYHEAAYYILQLMKGITPKPKDEEKSESESESESETKDKDLEVYDNDVQRLSFYDYIKKKEFGNRSWNIGGEKDDWNYLDERNPTTGLRGTTNRATRLANWLEDYANSLEEGKYNFEGSAYTDLNDLKLKIKNAVDELRNPEWGQKDKDALNQIGIDWRDYFNDGSGDVMGTDADGKPITYGLFASTLAAQNEAAKEAEVKQEQAQAQANELANRGVLNRVLGVNPVEAKTLALGYSEWLADTYGVGEQGFGGINQKVQELLYKANTFGDLTPLDKKELGNLLHYITENNPNYLLSNLSDLDWNELTKHNNLVSKNRKDFRRLPWQVNGRYTFIDKATGALYFLKPENKQALPDIPFLKSDKYNNYKNNFLIGTKKGEELRNALLRADYYNRTELTTLDIEYLASIATDIASIIDEEPISAAALAFAGAGARHHALANRPGGMSTADKWWQALDYVGAAFAAVPGAGDAYLVGRTFNTLKKFAVPLFIAAGTVGLGAEGMYLWTKFKNGEDLTLQDKINLLLTLPMVLSGVRIRNKRQLDTAAKEANQNTTVNKGKVTVTVTDKAGNKTTKEITGLSEERTKALQDLFKQAKTNSEKTRILRGDTEVKARAKEQGININKATIETPRPKRTLLPRRKKATEILSYKENVPNPARANYDAEVARLQNAGWWGRNVLARALREYDWWYKHTGGPRRDTDGFFKSTWNAIWNPHKGLLNTVRNGSGSSGGSVSGGPKPKPKSSSGSNAKPKSSLSKAESAEIKDTFEGKSFSSNNDVSDNATTINGFGDFYRMNNGDGTHTVRIELPDNSLQIQAKPEDLKKETLKMLKQAMKQVDKNLPKALKSKIKLEVVRELKRLGYLKQGGRFDLDKTISEFLNKLK